MEVVTAVRRYYEAWAAQDRGTVRELLHDDLMFASPQDRFASADTFLAACWAYAEGLTQVRFIEEVHAVGRAFVILEWHNEDGTAFATAEYLELREGRIKRILVVNNDPALTSLVA